MPVNIVKKLIKEKAKIQMYVCLSVLLFMFTNVGMFQNQIEDFFSLITGRHETVNSVAEFSEHLNSGKKHIKIETDKLHDTGIVARDGGKAVVNYIWVEFSDGIIIIKYPTKKFAKLDFNGKNKIRGLISLHHAQLIRSQMKTFFNDLEVKNYEELFAEQGQTFILDAGIEGISLKNILTVLFIVGAFAFLTAILIKNITAVWNYKLSKEYRALKLLGYETLEYAENSIIHAYNETQSACLFDDRRIFICKKYIILKNSAVFKNTSDLLYAKKEICVNLKAEEIYYVKLRFNNTKKHMRIEIPTKAVMEEIVLILQAEILQPTEAKNIVKSLLNAKMIRNLAEFVLALVVNVLFCILLYVTSHSLFVILLGVIIVLVILYNGLKELHPINYKNSQSYLYLKNFDYQTIEDAETAIIRDYNINFKEHIFENEKIFISTNFIIFKWKAEFREMKKLKNVQECKIRDTKRTIYYLRFYFNDGVADYHASKKSVSEIANIVKKISVHRAEYDTEEI